MVAPFKVRRQQVAVKIEVTEGTDSVPADVDVIAPAFDIEYAPTFEISERDVQQASFSKLPPIPGERSAVIRFATELKGSGTAGTVATNLSAPFRGCSMSETIVGGTSVTYAPVSQSDSSVTVEVREGSANTVFKSMKIVGARGTFTVEAVKGDIVLVRFEFTGRYIEPTDTTAFTTPAVGQTPLALLNASFSFHGSSLKVQNITIDVGNTVAMRNDANQASGNFSAIVTRRDPVGSVDPEREDVGTFNTFNRLTAGTEGILTYALTGSAGNIVTVTANKAQILNDAPADRDGIRIDTLDLQLNQDTAAGEDEFTIAMT